MKILILFLYLYLPLIQSLLNEKDIIDDVEVLKNRVWEGYETKVGAHYYAYSKYLVGYTEVTSFINLPEKLNTNNGKRNAYISFGVLGLNGAIDMGIMNSGSGWWPYKYDGNTKEFIAYKDDFAPNGTKIIGIQIKVNEDRLSTFSLSFRNSNLTILKSFYKELNCSHILVYENNHVKNRFYRFASLVPVEQDNQTDGTYMIGGEFNDLTIVRDNNGYDWGIALDDIDVAWKVSTKRINVTHDERNDKFDIIHKVYEIQNSKENIKFDYLIYIFIILILLN